MMNGHRKNRILTTVCAVLWSLSLMTQTGCTTDHGPDVASAEPVEASPLVEPPPVKAEAHAEDNTPSIQGSELDDDADFATDDATRRDELVVSRASSSPEFPPAFNGGNARPPRVLLSDKYAATCKKQIGDSLADLKFSKVDAGEISSETSTLESLLGKKLTVVVFCDLGFETSAEQVQRLEQEVSQIYQEFGVASLAIQVGDLADMDQCISQVPADTLLLVDTENQYESVATMRPPRTFLLDASGKIIWLDIEYSRGMRIELDNAIRFHLTQLFDTARSAVEENWR